MNFKMYGISVNTEAQEVYILYGYRFISIYMIHQSKRKWWRLFGIWKPTLKQCLYSIDLERKSLPHFIGYIKMLSSSPKEETKSI